MVVTPEQIKEALAGSLTIEHVEVETYEGQDHFTATVVSPDFAGRSRVEQHRMVYEPLRPMMTQAIHALELKTWTPLEWEDRKRGVPATKKDAVHADEDKKERK